MIENFLTIPAAPNYEINSRLVVRNKKTGRILTPSKNLTVCVRVDGKTRTFLLKTIREQALAAVETVKFYPIPSTGNKYEMNRNGKVRNAKTKRVLKTTDGGNVVHLAYGGKGYAISITMLKWEVFGITPSKSAQTPKPLSVSKGNRRFFFDTKAACARFLAAELTYSTAGILYYLSANKNWIHGWTVKYFDEPLEIRRI